MSVFESVAQLATTTAAVATILAPAAMAAGVAPRLGPGRAVALALRSHLESAGTRSSQRDADVKVLRVMTSNAARDQYQYCVVLGPKGVGEFVVAPRFQFARLFPPFFPQCRQDVHCQHRDEELVQCCARARQCGRFREGDCGGRPSCSDAVPSAHTRPKSRRGARAVVSRPPLPHAAHHRAPGGGARRGRELRCHQRLVPRPRRLRLPRRRGRVPRSSRIFRRCSASSRRTRASCTAASRPRARYPDTALTKTEGRYNNTYTLHTAKMHDFLVAKGWWYRD